MNFCVTEELEKLHYLHFVQDAKMNLAVIAQAKYICGPANSSGFQKMLCST